jgi:hypothetical protein
MRSIGLLAAVLALGACVDAAPPFETSSPTPAAPPPAAAGQFGNVDVNAIAACVRESATEGELAIMSLGGERAQTATAQVLGRPATQACLARSNVTLPGASL